MADHENLLHSEAFLDFAYEIITREYRTFSQFAKAAKIPEAIAKDVIAGDREPGDKFLAALNAERVVMYRFLQTPVDN